MIAALGVDADRAREFFQLVKCEPAAPRLLRASIPPFLQIAKVDSSIGPAPPTEFIHLSAVVATSNAVRNVQIANQLRLSHLSPTSSSMWRQIYSGDASRTFLRIEVLS